MISAIRRCDDGLRARHDVSVIDPTKLGIAIGVRASLPSRASILDGGQQVFLNRFSIAMIMALGLPAAFSSAAQAQTRDVLAVVNGAPIRAAEVDAKLGASLAKLQEQVYTMQRAQLESMVDEQLLSGEAAKRGITLDALTQAEINTRIEPVTTADASAFYEANKARLQGGTFAALQEQIKTHLTSQRLTARRQQFVASLREKATITMFLEAPEPFRSEVPLAGAPVRGNPNAPVTIVEFSDFHCPFCRRAHPVIQQLMTTYGDRVRLVYKDMPLDNLHPNARAASEAGLCAAAQGKFWEFHDKLFASEPDSSPATLNRLAQEVGIDIAPFEACYKERRFKTQIDASVQDGARLGVTGTPTFFINGRNLTGALPLESFAKVVDEELKRAQAGAPVRK
jgi:protein-disulfide isomerase